MDFPATKLAYFDDMWTLDSTASVIAYFMEEDRSVMVLDSTIFHPQGGGQPSDTGFISHARGEFKFRVQEARSRNGVVLHFGCFDPPHAGSSLALDKGREVTLHVDGERRELNSRLHSAGHLLDICMRNFGLWHLEPGKGNHFPDGSFVEYKGVIPQIELQKWSTELENEANRLISIGGKVSAAILPYEEAAKLCGGDLPDYISKMSTLRIVMLGNNLGCPCGGTHVANISDIRRIKVPQIRTKKGITKLLNAKDIIKEYVILETS